MKCKECRFFDGSCCTHDDFFIKEIEDEPRNVLLFKRRDVNEDDFCSWAEEGEFSDEGYEIEYVNVWRDKRCSEETRLLSR